MSSAAGWGVNGVWFHLVSRTADASCLLARREVKLLLHLCPCPGGAGAVLVIDVGCFRRPRILR